MYPERFLRKIQELWPGVPTLLFCPHGFRLNQRERSSRRQWLLDLQITSIISLPLDIFPETNFHVEIIAFNIPSLPAHVFLPKSEDVQH